MYTLVEHPQAENKNGNEQKNKIKTGRKTGISLLRVTENKDNNEMG